MKNKDKEYQPSDLDDISDYIKRVGAVNPHDVDMDKISWVIENGKDNVFYNVGGFMMATKAFAIQFLEHLDRALREKVKEMTNQNSKNNQP